MTDLRTSQIIDTIDGKLDEEPLREILIGPVTRANASRALQQQLAPVWQGMIEAAGGDTEGNWQLVIDSARLVRR